MNDSTFEPNQLPPEIAALLILIGVIAIPLPGPGVPFIVAGGLALWPKTFQPLDRNLRSKFPEAHASVFRILQRFENDLNQRYPKE
jgi:hypothetical protein